MIFKTSKAAHNAPPYLKSYIFYPMDFYQADTTHSGFKITLQARP